MKNPAKIAEDKCKAKEFSVDTDNKNMNKMHEMLLKENNNMTTYSCNSTLDEFIGKRYNPKIHY